MHNDKNAKNKYLPIFPYLTSARSQKFFGIVLTLCALSFFGLFAIRPTVSTILKLQKELSDNQFIFEQLETKIKNLTELRKQYFNLQGDLPIITNAITTQPDASLLLAQIQSIARTSNITITKLQNSEVEVIKNNSVNKDFYSYSFAIAGSGSLENVSRFIQSLANMERVVNINMFSIGNLGDQKSGSLGFDIQGTAFFKNSL